MPRKLNNKKDKLVILVLILAIILPIILFFLFTNVVISSSSMIDFKNLSVESLSEDQMNSLKGLKFVEGPSTDPKVITRERLPEKSRVIPEGHMVTMDWDPLRLNVHLDKDGNVKKVKKG